MKKLLLILFTVSISTTGFTQSVGDTFVDNFITYEITSVASNTVRTIGYNTGGGTSVTIPATVSDNSITYDVTNIGPNSFSNKQLTSISIPSSVTIIRSGSFQNNNLITVTIPANVQTIQAWSFMSNPLTTVTCLGLTPPFLSPAGGNGAFDDRSLIDLTVPFEMSSNYTSNGWTGFNSVTSATIFVVDYITFEVTSNSPNTVRTIGYNTSGGTSVVIPAAVSDNSIAYDVTSIGPNSFSNKQLTNVSIPSSVTIIRSGSFQNNNLTTVTIPENVSNIQTWSFLGNPLTSLICGNITPQTFPAGALNNIFDNLNQIALTVPFNTATTYTNAGWTGFASVTESSIYIVDNAVYLLLPTTPVTASVSDYSMSGGANALVPETVTINSTTYDVTKIEPNAFTNKQLISVSIPNTITEIGSGAFQNNPITNVFLKSLTPPTIPLAGVNDAFDNRSSIDLIIPNATTDAYVTDGGALWTGFKMAHEISSTSPDELKVTHYNETSGSNVNIPGTITDGSVSYDVTEIGNSAFFDKMLTSVNLPNTITTIGNSAFNTNSLTSVTIPDSVLIIGSQAFVTNDLTSVILGNSVETIELGAFVDNDLTSITIPSSVTSIGSIAFAANPLTSVTSLATTPPAITTGTNDTFHISGDRSGINLTIPSGTENAYIAAQWINFASVSLNTSDFELEKGIKIITLRDELKIISSGHAKLNNYSIYNMSGAKVMEGKEKSIPTETLSNGIYILQLDFNNGTVVKKFAK